MLKKRLSLFLSVALLLPACGGAITGKNIGKPVDVSVVGAVYEVGIDIANLATAARAVSTGVAESLP